MLVGEDVIGVGEGRSKRVADEPTPARVSAANRRPTTGALDRLRTGSEMTTPWRAARRIFSITSSTSAPKW